MSDATTEELVRLRRDLHAHPELGFEEHRTAAIVAARLRAAGLQVVEGVGGTGVVGTLARGEGALDRGEGTGAAGGGGSGAGPAPESGPGSATAAGMGGGPAGSVGPAGGFGNGHGRGPEGQPQDGAQGGTGRGTGPERAPQHGEGHVAHGSGSGPGHEPTGGPADGPAGGRAILLRADMDALAMDEAGGRPWQSREPGRMHACGHDGHTAMLLGAAERLAREGGFSGRVHFVFQPAEEGRGGARAMLADGLLQRFPAAMAFGLHNMPGLAPDRIAVVEGPQLASSDSWEVVLHGTGTHGAKPHLGRDALTAAGQFLAALPMIVARELDPLQAAVVSACAVEAGDFRALNVIPPRVRIGGTARAYTPEVRDHLEAAIGRIAAGVAAACGVRADYRFTRRIPPVVNAARACAPARQAAARAGRLLTAFPPSTAGDDFAWFAEELPGCYVWLGNGPAREGAGHHNPGYDFCDAALPTGVAFWVELVRAALPAR